MISTWCTIERPIRWHLWCLNWRKWLGAPTESCSRWTQLSSAAPSSMFILAANFSDDRGGGITQLTSLSDSQVSVFQELVMTDIWSVIDLSTSQKPYYLGSKKMTGFVQLSVQLAVPRSHQTTSIISIWSFSLFSILYIILARFLEKLCVTWEWSLVW